jgi:4-hydroxy-3-polyprenylbenzoate decarboxylase
MRDRRSAGPAHAEIVLEGYVELGELRSEGPFGDHTGFYTLTDEYPVFHLTCITHRKDPIYAATIVGKPPMEDAWMGKAVERIFLPAMKMQIPELVDIHLPVEGVFHNLMLVSIRKSYPGQARKVMNAIWSLGQAMFTKCIVVVDEDCDVQNVGEVVLRVANNIDPSATFNSRWARSIRSTTPRACPTTARRWASTPRANGRPKASTAPGPR